MTLRDYDENSEEQLRQTLKMNLEDEAMNRIYQRQSLDEVSSGQFFGIFQAKETENQ